MIHVIATITVKPGKRAEFLAVFNGNVPNVLAESGCLFYQPTVDADSGIHIQGALRENTVTVVEQWQSLDHLRAHLAAPHMRAYSKEVKEKDLVEGVALQVLEPAGV
ncbi:MAG: antibiotic biosynthesis monooxygenase [Candidatus Hydrogenedentes bacterium]|nr:antibiotic biosynthesis monooxygenase [Candidatus Hydrogenedentota bacterium]